MVASYETVVGLEVHAQLFSATKLFCGCSTAYGALPNTHVCPVCLALPGALPVPNRGALSLAIRAGLALGCKVRTRSRFARKNYFYPDLAKGYQISQFDEPLNEFGELTIEVSGHSKTITIQRAHVEEDAAKNLHGVGRGSATLVDFNRAGVPLIEIVSAPDLRSAEEAEEYLKRLRDVLMFVGVNDGNLEEGSFRCDANVSIRPVGESKLGTRVELKNINSFRFVRKAIEHEAARQQAIVSGGGKVIQETRTWSESEGRTISMRGKEEAHDYRYFPDPDLPPVAFTEDDVAGIASLLPELPERKKQRWQEELGLTPYDAKIMASHPGIAAYFEEVTHQLSAGANLSPKETGKKVANFVQSEVLRHVKTTGLDANLPVTAENLAELLLEVHRGTISGKMAKEVFGEMIEKGLTAAQVIKDRGLSQVTDVGAIKTEVERVLAAHPQEVEKYRAGKVAMFGFFVGQVMKASKGSANPALVNKVLKELLES